MRPRAGVSTYLEVFILVGVATGCSAIAYSAVSSYAASASGPSLSVQGASIRQGTDAAVVTMTVVDTGDTALSSVQVTAGASSPYCVSLLSSSGAVLSSGCPTLTTTLPIALGATLQPGGSVVAVVTFPESGAFTVGAQYEVTASAGGTVDALYVVAVPG